MLLLKEGYLNFWKEAQSKNCVEKSALQKAIIMRKILLGNKKLSL